MKINQDAFYKSQGFWWSIDNSLASLSGELTQDNVDGPYCINCQYDLLTPQNEFPTSSPNRKGILACGDCGRTFPIVGTIGAMKYKVLRQYVVQKRSEKPKISLDDPPSNVKVRDEDDKYFLSAKISEKDGKQVGVVYFGEKKKDQRKKDYTQIFLDLDDEQARFDKSNMPPQDILATLTVEFSHSIQVTNYRT